MFLGSALPYIAAMSYSMGEANKESGSISPASWHVAWPTALPHCSMGLRLHCAALYTPYNLPKPYNPVLAIYFIVDLKDWIVYAHFRYDYRRIACQTDLLPTTNTYSRSVSYVFLHACSWAVFMLPPSFPSLFLGPLHFWCFLFKFSSAGKCAFFFFFITGTDRSGVKYAISNHLTYLCVCWWFFFCAGLHAVCSGPNIFLICYAVEQ